MLNKETKLKDIVNESPVTMDLFNDLNIDYCCNGADSLEDVAEKKNIDINSLMSLIEKKKSETTDVKDEKTSDIEDFKKLSIRDMIKHLKFTHHQNEREMLIELDGLVNKILLAHYKTHSEELIELHKIFGLLKNELEVHFAKEEKLIFPLMNENENPSQEVIDYINVLEGEHEQAGALIKEMQALTNNFSTPEDACVTYERTYYLLSELVEDIFVHIFKENSILFPKYESLKNYRRKYEN